MKSVLEVEKLIDEIIENIASGDIYLDYGAPREDLIQLINLVKLVKIKCSHADAQPFHENGAIFCPDCDRYLSEEQYLNRNKNEI